MVSNDTAADWNADKSSARALRCQPVRICVSAVVSEISLALALALALALMLAFKMASRDANVVNRTLLKVAWGLGSPVPSDGNFPGTNRCLDHPA